MNVSLSLAEPNHIDEPQEAQGYAAVLSRVAAERQPVIVRRGGTDLAAVVPLELLGLMQELLTREEAERLASRIDWVKVVKACPPAQSWLEGEEPKPF